MSQTFTNIAAHLPEMARLQPDTPAIFCPNGKKSDGSPRYTQTTYRELDNESNRIAQALEAYGIRRGVRTVLMVPPGGDFFALTFALFKVGAVPILIDPGMGMRNLKACIAEAEPTVFIGIPKAHLARLLLSWGKPTLKILLTVGNFALWGGTTLRRLVAAIPVDSPYRMAATGSDETAAILFTSGSTGVPKGAIYSHGNFSTQVEMLRDLYAIRPGEIDLPTFPLFALFAPALGMTSVIPEMDFTRPAQVDPLKIITAIETFRITSMFGSPALLHRVSLYGEELGVQLPSLKRVISAGAPVPATVLARFSAMLPDTAQIFTPYGATEALPVCSIGSQEILQETRFRTEVGEGVCVGRPVRQVELEIIAISDAPIATWSEELKLPAGVIGEITVKGAQVTAAYHNRTASTALAKIADPAGGFWHRMGDLGYRDDSGRIWFCGRKSHRVETSDGPLYTIPCEGIFNTHPQVFRTALVGIGPFGAQCPVLCVELEKGVDPQQQGEIRRKLLKLGQQHPQTLSIETILFHSAFPVDIRHNAKIFREKLALWAATEVAK